ncbi:MAG: phosphatase PAP2 family protein [Dehalococcoidia bacterium]
MIVNWNWKVGALALGWLLTLVMYVLAWAFPTFPGDEAALVRFQELQTPWLTVLLRGVSRLGWWPVSFLLVTATVLALLWRRHRADALLLALMVFPIALGLGLKLVVGRPRPEYSIIDQIPGTLSFPSGHALFAILFGGLLIFLAQERVSSPRARRALQVGLALLILAVGASRVYLGVHWPSDVIGGYLLGGLALPELIRWRNRLKLRRDQSGKGDATV